MEILEIFVSGTSISGRGVLTEEEFVRGWEKYTTLSIPVVEPRFYPKWYYDELVEEYEKQKRKNEYSTTLLQYWRNR